MVDTALKFRGQLDFRLRISQYTEIEKTGGNGYGKNKEWWFN